MTRLGSVCGAAALACSATAAWLSIRDEFSVIANVLWLCAILMMPVAALMHGRIGTGTLRMFNAFVHSLPLRLEALALCAVTAVAFMLRAYDLAHFPPSMHGDEGEMGLLALRVLAGKEPLALFGTNWLDHPSLFHYLQALALLIFGRDEAGLRMLSALCGAACVPVTYALARMGWGRFAAFSAAWLMTVSALHIQYSRLGLNNIESVFGMVLLMLCLALMHQRAVGAPPDNRRALLLPVLAGLVIGLSQYLYYGSRLLPIVALPTIVYLWREQAIDRRQVAVMVIALLVAFLPLGVYYLNHPATFVNRMSGVSILREQNYQQALGTRAQLPDDALALLQVQLERNLGFFVRGGDASGFYLQDIPAFDLLTSLLFWCGLIAALTRARRYHEFAALAWFGVGLACAGLLTNDAPNGPRLIVLVPSVYLLAGGFVSRAARVLRASIHLRPRWLVAPVLAGATFVLLVNMQMYFEDYASESGNLAPIMVARAMAAYPQQDAYLLGVPNLYVEHGVLRFVAGMVRAHNLLSIADLPRPGDDGLLVIVLPEHVDALPEIESRMPGGSLSSYVDPLGRLIYVAYRIPPHDAD